MASGGRSSLEPFQIKCPTSKTAPSVPAFNARQYDAEPASVGLHGGVVHFAAMTCRDTAGDAQPQPAVRSACAAFFYAVKALEDVRAVFRGDAGAVVLDDERDVAPLPLRGDFHVPARRRIADGVVHQYVDRPLQHGLAALHQRQRPFLARGAQLDALLRRRRGVTFHRPLDQYAGLHGVPLPRLPGRGGQEQQVLGKPAHVRK